MAADLLGSIHLSGWGQEHAPIDQHAPFPRAPLHTLKETTSRKSTVRKTRHVALCTELRSGQGVWEGRALAWAVLGTMKSDAGDEVLLEVFRVLGW
jgi:hypothetical protein